MAMSEAGFTVGRIRDVQMLFAKPMHERRLAASPGEAWCGGRRLSGRADRVSLGA